MRYTLFLYLLVFSFSLSAQVNNDECQNAEDLGLLPYCEQTIFSNVGATPSNIGDQNTPDCFGTATPAQDVWFTFTIPDNLTDITIVLQGSENGGEGQPIINPQIALYRGSCDFNQLLEIGCNTENDGGTALRLDALGLTAGIPYFVRVNANLVDNTNFDGEFTLCIEAFEPFINMGDLERTTACSGRVFDSGGPAGNYKNNENQLLTICPDSEHNCILVELESFTIDEFDELNIYAGEDNTGTLLSKIQGSSLGTSFTVESSTACITLEFNSDNSATFAGFALSWSCQENDCTGQSLDGQATIPTVPFQGNFTTCGAASNLVNTPCNTASFLNGPELVMTYESPGGFCTSISINNAEPGTGVIVLDGPPNQATSTCVAQSQSGILNSVDTRIPGTYYIIVANGQGCTDFDIDIQETDCQLSPALKDALCTPINNCLDGPNEPFTIFLENGFKDADIKTGVNAGCWLNDGAEPDYYWFSVQAAEDGDFGFILESNGVPSDIDFNVWGPFTEAQTCGNPAEVTQFISQNQPIRSSWHNEAVPTGLARVHPVNGNPIVDLYDCGGTPSGEGDGFVLPVEMKKGEIYMVLINDWDNNVGMMGINMAFTPTDPNVLNPIPTTVIQGDTAICVGESTPILLENYSNEIRWVDNTEGLSCTDCPNPIATPTTTTSYTALIQKACSTDTVSVEVAVFDVNAGPNISVCSGEEFQISAGSNYPNAVYEWLITTPNADNFLEFSCQECPNPILTANNPNAGSATFTLRVTLRPDTPCGSAITDEVDITVFSQNAPEFSVADNLEICNGGQALIGDGNNDNTLNYRWFTTSGDTISNDPNPNVNPSEDTQYFVLVNNDECPVPSLDSVLVAVFNDPIINVVGDTTICQGDVLIGGNTQVESGVSYDWSGPETIFSPSNPNSAIRPEESGMFTLTAENGPCIVTNSFSATVTPSFVEIQQGDTLRICKGSTDTLVVNTEPMEAIAVWSASDGSINETTNELIISPNQPTTYYARVENENCTALDSIIVVIDSLPPDLSIMPADTTICEGSVVVLESPVFEPFEFPNINFIWGPSEQGNFQSPDSLYNLVITPDTTTTYFRRTENGACFDTTFAIVNVDTIPDSRIMPTDTTICFGESVDLLVEVNAPVEEPMWSPPESLSCQDCFNPTASPAETTTYTFQGMAGECPVSASATVNIPGSELFALPNQRTICLGDNIQLNTIEQPNVTYTWTSSDPNFSTTSARPVVSPITNTDYTLIVDDGICPPFEVTLTIEVLTEPEYQFPTETTICAGIPITLNTISSPGATYRWTASDPEFGQVTQSELSVSPVATTTYFLVVTNGACPPIEDQITILVTPQPALPTLEDISLCQGESTRLADSFDPNFQYSWSSTNDPGFSTTTDPTPEVSPNLSASYTLTVSNECGSVEGTVDVTVADPATTINLSATPGTEIDLGETVTLNSGIGNDQGNTFAWSTSDGVFVGAEPTADVSPQDTTTYLLLLTGGNNCFVKLDSITIFVKPKPDFRIPNAFTPNGDGDNDFFTVFTQGDADIVDFKVYNRWGQIVYDNDNNEMGWDGNHNGNPAPSDVYIFVIELDGVPEDDLMQKGDVTLIR